jgi:hypothetical protein
MKIKPFPIRYDNKLVDLWPMELGALLQFHCEAKMADIKRLVIDIVFMDMEEKVRI